MVASVRNALLATFALVAVACAAPESEEEVSDGDLAAALSRGESPVSDACFIPSSSLEVGTWVAYTVGSGDRTPTELLFVNHTDAEASIVVSVDVEKDRFKVLSAPPDGSGAPLVNALIHDLAGYEALDESSGASGSITTQNYARVTAQAAGRLLAKAATKLKVSGDDLLTAIKNYTGSGYRELNQFLRNGVVPTSWTKESMNGQARTLTQALKGLPPVNAETRRWVSVGVDVNPSVNAEKLPRFLEALKPGRVYQDRGFMSTTFDTKAPGVAGSATVRFDIKGVSGRDISMLSHFPSEKEVLFAPKTRFRVVSVTGEFVDRPSSYGPKATQWHDFVTATSEYFPGVTKASVDAQLKAGKVPNIVVKLEEIVR